MREQLIQYVELLFAGAAGCEDIKQEILQNTLDRYDDLIDSGKVPEAAYRLAIAGIGDINEILGASVQAMPAKESVPAKPAETAENDSPIKKLLRAIAVGLYILCPLPLIVLSDLGMDHLGLCGTLAIVAVATVLIMLGAKKEKQEDDDPENEAEKEESELEKSISGVLWAVGIGVYLLLSFSTGAWHMTWVIFPVLVALDSLISAIVRHQEALHGNVTFPGNEKVRKSTGKLIWALGTAVYFIFSFATGAWYISWLLFLITGAVQGLTYAILDWKEAVEHEA